MTVLFADLVGFTARAEQLDPEDVRAMLSPYHARLRDELERHGGTVEKFIGDAVMAVFGAPVVHEDDPERAVRAALAIRDWARRGRASCRCGSRSPPGEALVTLDARPERGRGHGRRRRRQHGGAAPVRRAGERHPRRRERPTARRAQAIEYREREPVEAKGKAEPVRVWEAVEARSRFGVDVAQRRRRRSSGAARARLCSPTPSRASREERAPQLVTLVGVPGIGKSRLVYELFARRRRAIRSSIYWRQGRSLPYGEGVSYWALAEMVEGAGRDPRERLRRRRPSASSRGRRALCGATRPSWIVADLRPLVGSAPRPRRRRRARASAFAAWRRFFEALAEQRPRCSSSRTCTGPTTTCSTSSTTSSTGRPACRCSSSAPPVPSSSSGGRAGAEASRTRRRSSLSPLVRRRDCAPDRRPARSGRASGRAADDAARRAQAGIRSTPSSSRAARRDAAADGAAAARERAGDHRRPPRRAFRRRRSRFFRTPRCSGRSSGSARSARSEGASRARPRKPFTRLCGRNSCVASVARRWCRRGIRLSARARPGRRLRRRFRGPVGPSVMSGPPAGSSNSAGPRITPRCWRITTSRPFGSAELPARNRGRSCSSAPGSPPAMQATARWRSGHFPQQRICTRWRSSSGLWTTITVRGCYWPTPAAASTTQPSTKACSKRLRAVSFCKGIDRPQLRRRRSWQGSG